MKFKLVLVLTICLLHGYGRAEVVVSDEEMEEKAFVAGAKDAAIGEFPHAALLVFDEPPVDTCDGSIINQQYIITSTNCFQDRFKNKVDRIKVIVGKNRNSKGEHHKVEKIIVHKDPFDKSYNQIVLLKLSSKIKYRRTVGKIGGVGPITLAILRSPQAPGQNATLAGFRLNSWEPSSNVVEKSMKKITVCPKYIDSKKFICVLKCNNPDYGLWGGAGSGLINKNFELIGIASYIFPKREETGPTYETYLRVSPYLDWVMSVITNRKPAPGGIATAMLA